jgi:DNA polymerase-1
MKKLIIIDSNALIHRSFHALPDTLKTKDGTLTNALYGFMMVFLKVIDEFSPDYIIATFDRKEKTFRHKMFEGYKAKRKKAPDELYKQIPLVQEALEAFGIPCLSQKGLEADDLIGIIAKQKKDPKITSIIVTGDKDTLQLIDSKTKVFTLKRGPKDTILYDEALVKEKIGVRPDQIVDFKALAGDPSDNIPGVKGIGQKTAVDLINEYDNLDNIYKNLDQIKPAVKNKLEAHQDEAYLSQKLARIQTDQKIDFDLTKAQFESDFLKNNPQKIKAILEKFEFYSLIKRLKLDSNSKKPIDKSLSEKKSSKKNFKITEINNLDAETVEKIKAKLLKNKKNSIYLDFFEKFTKKINEKSIFDYQLKYFSLLIPEAQEILIFNLKDNLEKKLKTVFNLINKHSIIGFDLKETLKLFKLSGLKIESIKSFDDLKIITYLASAGQINFTSDFNLNFYTDETPKYYEAMLTLKKGQTKLLLTEEDKDHKQKTIKNYLQENLIIILNNYQEEKNKLLKIADQQKSKKGYNLKFILEKIELPLLKVLTQMELQGIKLNKNKTKELLKDYQKETEKLQQKVFKLCGQKFNLDSSKQLSEIFYDKLKFSTKGIKKGKSGYYSTSAEALEILSTKYEVADLIGQYRELKKLINTYLKPLPLLINESTGRIHTQFNQTITSTGRLSSSNPNLQNIPIRTEHGHRIREAFVAEKNYYLAAFDYSQIELRLAAYFSKDPTMVEIFQKNGDIHRETAAKVHNLKPEKVTSKIRRTAKELNFGLIYGMGAYGFSRAAKIELKKAKQFIEKYQEKFPKMFEYLENSKEIAKEQGYVETLFGRRRYVNELHSSNWQIRASGERMAINMPLQGTAADIMKLALNQVYNYLNNNKLINKIKPLLTVHDEILFEVKKDISKNKLLKLQKIMENIIKLEIPLKVDLKTGKNWGLMQDFKFKK